MNGDGEHKKPILRWTFGNCKHQGFLVLLESIRRAMNIYGDLFDFVVVYNNQNQATLDKVRKTGVRLVEAIPDSLPFAPFSCKWKLYPPRLDMSVHEIVIDNDWVFLSKLPVIDLFLNDDATMIYEGIHGLHGSFDKTVPCSLKINSGCYGMPPGYDFGLEIRRLILATGHRSWQDHFDDQGVVGSTLPFYKRVYVVSQSDFPCVDCVDTEFPKNAYGYHFVSANRNEAHPLFMKLTNKIRFF